MVASPPTATLALGWRISNDITLLDYMRINLLLARNHLMYKLMVSTEVSIADGHYQHEGGLRKGFSR